jgi:two-component system chemotaxis sensor kinase CheA
MKKIYDSTESLIDLVNNILDLSKIEAGRMEKIISPVNISELTRKCKEDFMGIYTEKNIQLLLTDRASIHILSTDESKVRMILINLLSNAYKFTAA